MHILLVHDKDAEKAAACVDVRVGSLSDPPELPGLAHFTEHMLFYGSERYPEEDEYSKFISDRGGMTNAYTSAESTNYHFDVNWDSLEPALDRFAQFFIAPLISEDGVEREVRAVDSEHGKNINADVWRQMQLWRGATNQQHSFSRFHTGNYETLMTRPKKKGLVVHEEVRAFWQQHYSANVMKAAIVGRQPLEELEALAREKFGPIRNQQLTPPTFSGDIVTAAEEGVLLKVVPEKDWHTLELQWAVPPEIKAYRAQPCGYISHLLGHESEGSVFAALKAKGLAVELSAGESGMSFSGASLFSVSIVLTDQGHKRVDEVLALVFDYLAVLQGPDGISEAVWEENRALSELRFNFAERLPPLTAAQSLAHAMQDYADKDVLLAMHHVPQDFEPAAIRRVLDAMTPAASRILWASKSFKDEAKETEYFYGALFARGRIPQEWVQRWQSPQKDPLLHLPAANPFVSTDFTMQQENSGKDAEPVKTVELPLVTMWSRPDTSFERPKAVVFLGFASPAAYADPTAAVLTKLFVRLLSDALNEVSYAASLAGLHTAVDSTVTGFQLSASGYSHKLLDLVRTVLDKASTSFKEERFEVVREALAKDYAAMAYDQPYQRALYSSSLLLEARKWHVDDYSAVVGQLTPADLQAFIPQLLGRCRVTAYVTGNLPTPAAEGLARHLQNFLSGSLFSRPPFAAQVPEKRVVKLPAGRPTLFAEPVPNAGNANSAIAVTFQTGPDDLARNAAGQLVAHLAKRDAFQQLRTQQQLGYLVHMSAWNTLSIRSLIFIIQSTAFPAAHLDAAVDQFLVTFGQRLDSLSQEEFEDQVEELAKAKLEAPKTLREVASRHWQELDGGTCVWNRPVAETAALRALTLPDLRTFYQEAILGPASRRKLSVHVLGATELSPATGPAAADGADADSSAAAAAVSSEPQDGAPGGAANASAAAEPAVAAAPNAASEAAQDGTCSDGQAAGSPGDSSAQNATAEPQANSGDAAASSSAAAAATALLIKDIWEFKRSQELWPSPAPTLAAHSSN